MLPPGQHLVTVLNDILDYEKVQSGRMELEYVAFDLVTLIESSLAIAVPASTPVEVSIAFACVAQCTHRVSFAQPGCSFANSAAFVNNLTE